MDFRTGICEFHYASGKVQEGGFYVQAQSREVIKPNKTMIAGYAVCRLCCQDHRDDWPVGVAMVPANYTGPKQVMMIRGNRQVIQMIANSKSIHDDSKKLKELAVCVRPMFGNFNNYQQLASFLMYYWAAGAEHFVFYNAGATTPRMLEIFKLARNSGMSIELRSWVFGHLTNYSDSDCRPCR